MKGVERLALHRLAGSSRLCVSFDEACHFKLEHGVAQFSSDWPLSAVFGTLCMFMGVTGSAIWRSCISSRDEYEEQGEAEAALLPVGLILAVVI